MSYTNETAKLVADSVLGTCGYFGDAALEEWKITQDEFEKILYEEGVFLCDCCGWYCDETEANDSSHYHGDKICTDCWEIENEE